MLITSRKSQWPTKLPIHPPLILGLLDRSESIQLLQSYRPDLDQAEANQIAEELGDLPLALGLAGHYLEDNRTAAFGKPRVYLKNVRSKLLKHASLDQDERSVQATFDTSFERLDKQHSIDSIALALLARASYFAPNQRIPQELLQQTVGEYDPEDEEQALPRVEGLKRLLDLGFLEQTESGDLQIHRLIANYAQVVCKDDQAQNDVETKLVDQTNKLVDQGYPARLSAIVPHIDYRYHLEDQRSKIDQANFALALGGAKQAQLSYGEAEPLYLRALAIYEQVLGLEHPTTAIIRNNLSYLQQRIQDKS